MTDVFEAHSETHPDQPKTMAERLVGLGFGEYLPVKTNGAETVDLSDGGKNLVLSPEDMDQKKTDPLLTDALGTFKLKHEQFENLSKKIKDDFMEGDERKGLLAFAADKNIDISSPDSFRVIISPDNVVKVMLNSISVKEEKNADFSQIYDNNLDAITKLLGSINTLAAYFPKVG